VARRLAIHFWPTQDNSAYNSVPKVLEKLRDEKCFPVDEVARWVNSGAQKKDISFTLGAMQRPPSVHVPVPLELDDDNKGGSSILGKKRRINSPSSGASSHSELDSGSGSATEVEDDDAPLLRGNLSMDLSMEQMRFFLSRLSLKDEGLDDKKLAYLESLFPTGDLALAKPLTTGERGKILNPYPKFSSIMPKARKKDLSNLSTKLSRADKEMIDLLFKCQLRSREKLRVVLFELYSNFSVHLS
jgi:hypothetical protein